MFLLNKAVYPLGPVCIVKQMKRICKIKNIFLSLKQNKKILLSNNACKKRRGFSIRNHYFSLLQILSLAQLCNWMFKTESLGFLLLLLLFLFCFVFLSSACINCTINVAIFLVLYNNMLNSHVIYTCAGYVASWWREIKVIQQHFNLYIRLEICFSDRHGEDKTCQREQQSGIRALSYIYIVQVSVFCLRFASTSTS